MRLVQKIGQATIDQKYSILQKHISVSIVMDSVKDGTFH